MFCPLNLRNIGVCVCVCVSNLVWRCVHTNTPANTYTTLVGASVVLYIGHLVWRCVHTNTHADTFTPHLHPHNAQLEQGCTHAKGSVLAWAGGPTTGATLVSLITVDSRTPPTFGRVRQKKRREKQKVTWFVLQRSMLSMETLILFGRVNF